MPKASADQFPSKTHKRSTDFKGIQNVELKMNLSVQILASNQRQSEI